MKFLCVHVNLVAALLFHFPMPVVAQEEIADYIISVIQHLTNTETGVPVCVFFGMPLDFPFDYRTEQVIASPKLAHVTKYLVTIRNQMNCALLPNKPLLIVIHVGGFFGAGPSKEEARRNFNLFISADPTTKLLVLVNTRAHDFKIVKMLCKHFSYIDVVILDAANRLMFRSNSFETVEIPYLMAPERLFVGPIPKIAERGITVTEPNFDDLTNPNMVWALETAKYLKTPMFATKNATLTADFRAQYLRLSWFERDDVKLFQWLLPPYIDAIVVLVPRNRMDVFQMFAVPFKWEVWLVILALLIAAEAVKFFLPAFLKNNPILLVVCGFERYNLHKAGRFEKLFLHSLIIFAFFMTCAYETKIVSLMISQPPGKPIDTIQQLNESGIKIRRNKYTEGVINDTQIDDLFVTTNDTRLAIAMNGVYASIVVKEWALALVTLTYDQTQRRNTYIVMEEPIMMLTRAYLFDYRCPLIKTFEHTFQIFLESGLMENWQNYVTSEVIRSRWFEYTGSLQTKDVLTFSDMVLAWVALAIGLSIGLVLFACELIVMNLTKCAIMERVMSYIRVKFHRLKCRKIIHNLR